MKAAARVPADLAAPDEGRTPESFLEEIQAILDSGTLRGAREVAEQGLALYPDHPELHRLHHALRPYEKARINPGFKISDPRPSYEWLARNSARFADRWVALAQGELVAAADSLDEVREAARDRRPGEVLFHHILG